MFKRNFLNSLALKKKMLVAESEINRLILLNKLRPVDFKIPKILQWGMGILVRNIALSQKIFMGSKVLRWLLNVFKRTNKPPG